MRSLRFLGTSLSTPRQTCASGLRSVVRWRPCRYAAELPAGAQSISPTEGMRTRGHSDKYLQVCYPSQRIVQTTMLQQVIPTGCCQECFARGSAHDIIGCCLQIAMSPGISGDYFLSLVALGVRLVRYASKQLDFLFHRAQLLARLGQVRSMQISYFIIPKPDEPRLLACPMFDPFMVGE